jgi:hypothetical protein
MSDDKEYKVGDRVWWWHGQIFIRCTITRVDRQWRDRHPDGILFYDIDEPVGHSQDAESFTDTLEEAVGPIEDWDSEEIADGEEPTLDIFRRNSVRFILSTQTDVAGRYAKTEMISDEAVEKAIAEWKYPLKQRGEDWLTFEEALERIKPTTVQPPEAGHGM